MVTSPLCRFVEETTPPFCGMGSNVLKYLIKPACHRVVVPRARGSGDVTTADTETLKLGIEPELVGNAQSVPRSGL